MYSGESWSAEGTAHVLQPPKFRGPRRFDKCVVGFVLGSAALYRVPLGLLCLGH